MIGVVNRSLDADEDDIDVRGALMLTFHEACYDAWSEFPEAP